MKTLLKIFAVLLLLAGAGSTLAAVRYVDVNSTNATAPYTNWTTAATIIQDAVDAAVAGDEIVVTNGIYATGGSAANRVDVDKRLNVRSVNGPQFTAIYGDAFSRIRCVYLTTGASLSGFTLTRGYAKFGGGAYGGTLSNCTLTGNQAHSDGVFPNNAYGGGAAYCRLNNCMLTRNQATYQFFVGDSSGSAYGGGAYQCTLDHCTLIDNSADTGLSGSVQAYGGGASDSWLNNCTLAGNSAYRGGGAHHCTLSNCIVYFNRLANYASFPLPPSWFYFCCTVPQIGGVGNITNAPLFVDTNGWADLRLQSNSPCINAGWNALAPAGLDLDGNPRVAGGSVDIGAYEFQSPASIISYAWLQQFNLPTNPATDTADPDGDGVDNYREWLAGSDPTNPFSFPPLLTVIPCVANVILTWPTNAVGFTLQSTTNLVSPAGWTTNSPAPVVIGGQNVVTNPVTGPQQFYRLRQ